MKILKLNMIKITKYLHLIFYYLLLLLGLIMTSWIIWSRFIRERTIRDIPDMFMSEFRFWILIYICIIYIIVIKNLIKPVDINESLAELSKFISDIIYKPLKTLDHLIKYNKYVKPYYYKIMFKFLNYIDYNQNDYSTDSNFRLFIFFIQVFPRLILVLFLLTDTFYFHHIELFYNVILIGVIPFMWRYIKYTLKDIQEVWIVELENKYDLVYVYEKNYAFDKTRIGNTKSIHHDQERTIREYIEIKFNNVFEYINNKVENEYDAFPYVKKEVIEQFHLEKYGDKKDKYRTSDIKIMEALYYELIPYLHINKFLIERITIISETSRIKWSKIILFILYLIAWGYILIISYYTYPFELLMAKTLLKNFMIYLINIDNPFAELYWNENIKTNYD